MTDQELKDLKESLKAEILAEMTQRKVSESAWKKAKKSLNDKVFESLGRRPQSYQFVDAIATIGRIAYQRSNVNQITESEVEAITQMFDEMLSVANKYRRIAQERRTP